MTKTPKKTLPQSRSHLEWQTKTAKQYAYISNVYPFEAFLHPPGAHTWALQTCMTLMSFDTISCGTTNNSANTRLQDAKVSKGKVTFMFGLG